MYVLAKLAAFVSKIPVAILTRILEDKELSVAPTSVMIIYVDIGIIKKHKSHRPMGLKFWLL